MSNMFDDDKRKDNKRLLFIFIFTMIILGPFVWYAINNQPQEPMVNWPSIDVKK